MKIIKIRQENICYMMKDRQIKIDRSDVWGDPQKNRESILSYCQNFLDTVDDTTAHVIYLYGQGGIGKSFVYREITEKLNDDPYKNTLYVIAIDLQKQKHFEDNLKCLADEISAQTGVKDLFPRFHIAYYNYKLKAGEKIEQEERSTKWEDMNSTPFSLLTGTASLLSSFGAVSDVIDLANEGYKWFLKIRNSMQYKVMTRQIEAMEEQELRGQLIQYFAADFYELIEHKKIKQKKFAFLLDTVESMRYQTLRDGKGEDYLEWLAGNNGLFQLLPNCFWILFGREDIAWKNYDKEWEFSFLCKELQRPAEGPVREYLLGQFGQNIPKEKLETDMELNLIVDEIIRQTQRYSLAIENCVDVYFRIWNENLRKNRITDENTADRYRPKPDTMKEMCLDKKGQKMISNRFLQYYTPSERTVLYTLVCLGTWTDEILETLIWNGSVNNILIYEEMCATSFIQSKNGGQKSIEGLMLDTIMKECSQDLKRQLFLSILQLLSNRDIDDTYLLLYRSAVHIIEFYTYDQKEWLRLGTEFIRVSAYFKDHVQFHELLMTCDNLLQALKDRKADEDIYNAALIGKYFAHIFLKKDASEINALRQDLAKCNVFGNHSLEIWKIMIAMAEEVFAYTQAYEITTFLTDKFPDQSADTAECRYLLHYKRAELMQSLCLAKIPIEEAGVITEEMVEEEIDRLCSIPGRNTAAQKANARLIVDFYFRRQDLSEEFIIQKIQKAIQQYRDCCTYDEAKWDPTLYALEIMKVKAGSSWDAGELSEPALKGMRLLEQLHGEKAVDQPDMEFFFRSIYPDFTPKDNEEDRREDRELYRRIYAAYNKKFYKDGDWQSYHILKDNIFFRLLQNQRRNEVEKGSLNPEDNLDAEDMLKPGIFYLSNLSVSNMSNRLRLFFSYLLLRSSKGVAQSDSWLKEKDKDIFFNGSQLMETQLLNNQILLYFLHTSVNLVCNETNETDMQRLHVLLKAIFKKESFAANDLTLTEKGLLLGLLEQCGIATDKAAWKAEYTGRTENEEFKLLKEIYGWQWGLDKQADNLIADTVLFVVHTLAETPEETEKQILDLLNEHFPAPEDKKGFEPQKEALSEESILEEELKTMLAAENYEDARSRIRKEWEEWEEYRSNMQKRGGMTSLSGKATLALFYLPVAKNHGTDGFIDALRENILMKFDKGYCVLRAYAYLNDKDGFAAYYWEKKQEIRDSLHFILNPWRNFPGEFRNMALFIHSIEDTELLEDFCGQLVDMYADNFVSPKYKEGILDNLEWLNRLVPFKVVWRKDVCSKECNLSNYRSIYESIKNYLEPSELLDIFTSEGLTGKPGKTQLSFFENEYFLWLQETFPEEAEKKLRAKFPELFAAKESYEEKKDSWLYQLNKMTNEIKDCITQNMNKRYKEIQDV